MVGIAAGCSGGGGGDDDDDGETPTPTPTGTAQPTPTPAAITGVTPEFGKVGTVVTVSGSLFGATQGTSELSLGTLVVTPDSWSDGAITFTVPLQAVPGSVPVTVTRAGAAPSEPAPFEVILPHAIYTHDANGMISAFSWTTGGVITPLAGSPYAAGTAPLAFTGDASNLAVHAGTLAVYATMNAGLAAFHIDPTSGVLTAVPGSPFVTGLAGQYGVEVRPDGRTVYVQSYNASATSAFAVATNGVLSLLPGSPFPGRVNGGTDCAVTTHNGNFFIANQQAAGFLDVYGVAADGALSSATVSNVDYNSSVYTLATHPERDHVYGIGDTTAIVGYAVNPDTGAITILPGSPYPVASSHSIAITRDGNRLYVSSITGAPALAGFAIAASGALTPLVNSPFPSGINVAQLATGRDPFLFGASQGGDGVQMFAIGSSGAAVPVGTPFFTSFPNNAHIEVTP